MLKKSDTQKWKKRLVYLVCFLFFLGGSWSIFNSFTTNDLDISADELFRERLILIITTIFFSGCGLFLYLFEKENNKENRFISKHSSPIIIRGSRTKNLALFFGCSIFVLMCFPLTFYPDSFGIESHYKKIMIGGIGLVFFGFGLIVSFFKIFNNNTSLIINDRGIIISSGVLKPKTYFWKNIASFNEVIINSNKFISINLINPINHINNQKSWIVRKYYSLINSTNLSIISISSSNLDIGHQQLFELLNNKLIGFIKKEEEKGTQN